MEQFMEHVRMSNIIECNFRPPEVSLNAFISHETGESLASLVDNNPYVLKLRSLYAGTDQLEPNELAHIEQEVVSAAAEAVRKCVRYELGSKPWQEKPSGDCFTFTWLLSDIAERVGLGSCIAFCNGHAFNLIRGRSGEVHMVNGESKHMWFFDAANTTTARDTMDFSVMDELENSNSQVAFRPMQTFGLKIYSNATKPTTSLPWLDAHHPGVAVMKPDYAKQALFTYTCFKDALQRGNLEEVTTALNGLKTHNPQIETRARLNEDLKRFASLVKHWVKDDTAEACQITAAILGYVEAMPHTKSMMIFAADCLRRQATSNQDISLLDAAQSFYDEARHLKPNKRDLTLTGKVQKLAETRANMTSYVEVSR